MEARNICRDIFQRVGNNNVATICCNIWNTENQDIQWLMQSEAFPIELTKKKIHQNIS